MTIKKSNLPMLIALISLVISLGVQSKTPTNEKHLICQIQGENVFVVKDPGYVKFIPQSVLLGSAVYESKLYIRGKEINARFDCRIDRENISFSKDNYIFVDPKSCAGELHRAVCGN